MSSEEGREGPIDQAVRRLDQAASRLEQRIALAIEQAKAQAGSLIEADRGRLAAELDAVRGRERELAAAGAEASKALADAIGQLRGVIDSRAEA